MERRKTDKEKKTDGERRDIKTESQPGKGAAAPRLQRDSHIRAEFHSSNQKASVETHPADGLEPFLLESQGSCPVARPNFTSRKEKKGER